LDLRSFLRKRKEETENWESGGEEAYGGREVLGLKDENTGKIKGPGDARLQKKNNKGQKRKSKLERRFVNGSGNPLDTSRPYIHDKKKGQL